MNLQRNNETDLYITSVDNVGPYLRVSGQLDHVALQELNNSIRQLLHAAFCIEESWSIERKQALLVPGTVCIYHAVNDGRPEGGAYLRARIINVDEFANAVSAGGQVGHLRAEIDLIDFGYKETVSSATLYFVKHTRSLFTIRPLVTQYILLGVFDDWSPSQLARVSELIQYNTVTIRIVKEAHNIKFINIVWRQFNLSDYLIERESIGTAVQDDMLIGYFREQHTADAGNNNLGAQLSFGQCNLNNNYAGREQQQQLQSIRRSVTERLQFKFKPQPLTALPQASSTPLYGAFPTPIVPNRVYAPRAGAYNGIRPPVGIRPAYRHASQPPFVYQQPRPRMSFTDFLIFLPRTLSAYDIHDVIISSVQTGPYSFSVQLKSDQPKLEILMRSLERSELMPLTKTPFAGMACMVRYSQDNAMYRAIVLAAFTGGSRVHYIDYGNMENVPNQDLFKLPRDMLDIQPFAIHFALSGIRKLEPVDDDLRKSFKDMVFNKYFKLRVEATEGASFMQYCTLFNDELSIYDALRRRREVNCVFPAAEPLMSKDTVVIRYIKVPKEFYVQKVENIQKFDALMNIVCAYYNKYQIVPTDLWIGAACVAKFGSTWYRAEVVVISGREVTVRHVDFGCYQKTDLRHLSVIERQHMVLPRQVVRCCLRGFDHIELNKPATKTQLEMLAEESTGKRRPFTVEMHELLQTDGVSVVNLHTSEMNVMKRLLKLSMPMQDYLALERQDFNSKALAKICAKESTAASEPETEALQKKVEQLSLAKHNKRKEWDKQSSSSESSKDNASRRTSAGDTKSAKNRNVAVNETNQETSSVQQRLQRIKQEASNSNRRSNKTPFQRVQQEQQQQTPPKKPNTTTPNNEKLPENTVNSRLLRKTFKELHPAPSYSVIVATLPLQMDLPVEICWWISPQKFFIHLKSELEAYATLQTEIEAYYNERLAPKQLQLRVGNFIICRHRTLNKILRAKIVEYKYAKRLYRVFFVDLGDQLVVSPEDVWPLEEQFSTLPCMAYQCTIGNIIALRDQRTITDRIKEYFAKGADVLCKCLSQSGTVYGVDININGVPLKPLATPPAVKTEPNATINLSLLAGQQVRGKILNVQDIYNFKVLLEHAPTKLELASSYDDVAYKKLNPAKANEFKQFYEGKTWTLTITAITENKKAMLHPVQSLFESESAANICSYPVYLDMLKARIVRITDYFSFYVHLAQNANMLESNRSKMNAFYKKNGKTLTEFKPKQLCAAKHPKDSSWQRARLLSSVINLSSKHGRSVVDVLFVDLGQTARISTNDLRYLDDSFCSKPALALEVNLPIIDCVKTPAAVKRHLATVVDDVHIKPIEVHGEHIIADVLLSNGESMLTQLSALDLLKQQADIEKTRQHLCVKPEPKANAHVIETIDLTCDEEQEKPARAAVETPQASSNNDSGIVEEEATTEPEPEQEPAFVQEANIEDNMTAAEKIAQLILDEINASAPVRSWTAAMLGHCDNPTHFYVHPSSRNSELQSLQENLQIIAPSLPKVNKISKGTECVALCSVDKHWYRARVLDAEIMVLKFIDYGRTDYVPNAMDIRSSVKPELEPFCLPCALPVRPAGTSDWVDAANNIFIESHGKQVLVEYLTVGSNEKPSYVNLFIDDTDIVEQLIADGYAKTLETAPNDEKCYISHCNSISDFYVQFEHHNKALKFIEDYLEEEQARFEPLTQHEPSKLVAALFADDGNFYRAELLAEAPNDAGAYEVRFIDYGNTSVSKNCRLLPQEIADIPALSKRCALQLPKNCLSWSPEAESHFSALAQQGAVYTLELVQPADGYVLVNLLIDGHNIVEDLVKLCDSMVDDLLSDESESLALGEREVLHEGVVVHVASCFDFYVRLKDDASLESKIQEKLNSMELSALVDTDRLVGTLCAVRYAPDGMIYRADIAHVIDEIVPQYRVKLIDYGYETTTPELFLLPGDLGHLKPLVKRCQLSALGNSYRHSIATSETFNALLAECGRQVLVEFCNSEQSEPMPVGLYTADDSGDLLKKLKQRLQESTDCVVTHVNTPASFYMQRVSDLEQRNEIEQTLQPAKWEQLAPLAVDELREGEIYVCRLDEQDVLRRCSLESAPISGTELAVRLIDFGQTLAVKELRRLPANLECLPALAIHCELKEAAESERERIELTPEQTFRIKGESVNVETGRHVIEFEPKEGKEKKKTPVGEVTDTVLVANN